MTSRVSLAFRLFAGAAAWALALLLVGAIALSTLYQRSVIRTLDDRLTSIVGALVAAAETNADGAVALARRPSDPAYGRVFSGRYWQIVDAAQSGEDSILIVSRSLWDETLAASQGLRNRAQASPGQIVTGRAKGPAGEPLRVVAQAVLLPDREGVVIMMAGEDRRPADRDVRNFAITSAVLLLGFAAAIAAGVFFQVRIGLAPVLRMRNSVADVREGRSERVDGQFPTELQPLADELNAMLDHSRELVERSRTHVGNLAHALKTPIAVLTNEAREAGDDFGDLVGRQTAIMAEQVDHHLRMPRRSVPARKSAPPSATSPAP